MGRRFSDIERGAELKAAFDYYQNYKATKHTQPSRVGSQGARDLSKRCYVQPFTAGVAVDQVCMARASADSYTQLATAVNNVSTASVTDALTTQTLVTLPGFRAARVVLFINATRQVSTPNSRLTGQPYLKYEGDRYSLPFGASADADDMMEAFLDIKSSLLSTHSDKAVARVSLSREYVGVR